MMVDEFGMMEVIVDGEVRRRKATVDMGRLLHGGIGPHNIVPEAYGNERVVQTLSGQTYIVKVRE